MFTFYFFNLSEESKGDEEETPKVSEEKTPESEEVAAQDESSGEKQWTVCQQNEMSDQFSVKHFVSWGCFHDKIFLPWPKFTQTLYKQMNLAVFRVDLYSCFKNFLMSLNYFIKVHQDACVDLTWEFSWNSASHFL